MYAYQFAITWQLIKMENGDEVVARSVGTCPRQNDSLLEIRVRGNLRSYAFFMNLFRNYSFCITIFILEFGIFRRYSSFRFALSVLLSSTILRLKRSNVSDG